MSNQAIRNRSVAPSLRELQTEITARELLGITDWRESVNEWADYLIETGRIYQ